MMTQEIAGQTYEQRDCFTCATTGKTRDATNADKVETGGVTEGSCPRCKGDGYTLHLVTATPAPRPATEPVDLSETPSWML